MAKFKVGQRVKCIAYYAHPGAYFESDCMLGHEGTIVRRGLPSFPDEWTVDFPDCPGPVTDRQSATEWDMKECELAPLTDPKADAFIESIKKMKPYTEPTVKPREVLSSGAADRTNVPDTE